MTSLRRRETWKTSWETNFRVALTCRVWRLTTSKFCWCHETAAPDRFGCCSSHREHRFNESVRGRCFCFVFVHNSNRKLEFPYVPGALMPRCVARHHLWTAFYLFQKHSICCAAGSSLSPILGFPGLLILMNSSSAYLIFALFSHLYSLVSIFALFARCWTDFLWTSGKDYSHDQDSLSWILCQITAFLSSCVEYRLMGDIRHK